MNALEDYVKHISSELVFLDWALLHQFNVCETAIIFLFCFVYFNLLCCCCSCLLLLLVLFYLN